MENKHMNKLLQQFTLELYKELGQTPDYDVENREFIVPPIVIKFIGYARGIGYDEGICQVTHRKPIKQMKDGRIIAIHDSVNDAARSVGVHPKAISKVVTGKRKNCMKFQWVYA